MFNKKNNKRFAIVYRNLDTFVLTSGIFGQAELDAMANNPCIWVYAVRELGA